MQLEPFKKPYKVACHTAYVTPGSTFVAIKGVRQDGALFIPEALKRGATKIVVGHDALISDQLLTSIYAHNAVIEWTANTRAALAHLSAQAYDFPAKKLKIIGITATKGKSTTTITTAHLLRANGYKVALISGIYNQILDEKYAAPLTTPQPDYIHCFLAECVEKNVEYVVLETAAQALSLHRLDGIELYRAAFINFAHEHAEFYSSMDAYFAAKSKLFTLLSREGIGVINIDDAACKTLVDEKKITVSFNRASSATYVGSIERKDSQGMHINVVNHLNNEHQTLFVHFIGNFNAYNALIAFALARSCGISSAQCAEAFLTAPAIPGRMERYNLESGATLFIDYAANPQSYEAVLSEIRPLTQKLTIICGAGGERDPHKRPIMGSIATQYADTVFFTTDNPRSENPADIINQMCTKVLNTNKSKCIIELDRKIAIEKACAQSNPGEIILVLGKGAERYQQIGSEKIPFSEPAIIAPFCNQVNLSKVLQSSQQEIAPSLGH